MRFPREAIDVLAEMEAEEIEEEKLTFTPSTVADAWTKQEITRQPYEDEDAVPFKTVLAWRKRNDQISMHVEESDKILGWTTFLPLDEKIALALVHGEIREKDIPIKAIKKWTDKRLSVYIPIIEAIPTGNRQRDKDIGSFLLRNTLKWAVRLTIQYDIKNWYAVGTTPEGQGILEALEFRQISTLDEGERKGYVLETKAKQVRLINVFSRRIDGGLLLPREKEKTTVS